MDVRTPALLTLRVSDLRRSLAFWHGTLGLPVRLRTDTLAELQSETVRVVLVLGTGSPSLGWEVGDLDGERRALEGLGIACEAAPAPAGEADSAAFGRRIAFRDPDGHVLELVSWN